MSPERSVTYVFGTDKTALVGERGFEPPTPWSRTRCSTRLSHSPTGIVDRVVLSGNTRGARGTQYDLGIIALRLGTAFASGADKITLFLNEMCNSIYNCTARFSLILKRYNTAYFCLF